MVDAASRNLTRTTVQKAAVVVALAFLAVGVLGFIPGITTNYDTMMFGGHHSDAKLLGLFQVSILHNVVHLLFGIAGLLLARSVAGARNYLIGGGIIYLVLWVYGLVIDHASAANFVPLNTADNWLHLLLGLAMVLLGVVLSRRPVGARGSAR
ncbi:uncharacterized protein DUF4383 [Kribbella voronezhensis]|uniref:Uncharacterized protein DUF4383 n=1 Tax=Kribbella voronezhensis TaxID=2512212 RepID=A0A4R7SX07_9ACTN|nr:DUF4383 domain-containing protein [Kribbella voronezhensis]TDU83892.1 uncharacterized protein DUF4383 [Kribbella voronezhensis]